jgi:aquaporin Z
MIAAPVGMFTAAQSYVALAGADRIFCAKLHHHNRKRCIFRCNHDALVAGRLD